MFRPTLRVVLMLISALPFAAVSASQDQANDQTRRLIRQIMLEQRIPGLQVAVVKDGKVRVIGNSNHSANTMFKALAISTKEMWPRFENLQTQYNLYDRSGYERELEAFCLKNEIGVTSYFSLAKGFLSGKYRSEADFAKSNARGGDMGTYLNERGLRILAALDAVAEAKNATPAQVAIAWLIARPGIVAPIASATSVEQLSDLIKATELNLGSAEIEQLTKASA